MKKYYVMIHVYTYNNKLAQVKTWFFPTALTAQTAQKLQIPVSFHVMFYDKHNINLDVLIFPKTYVCKHESKHKR